MMRRASDVGHERGVSSQKGPKQNAQDTSEKKTEAVLEPPTFAVIRKACKETGFALGCEAAPSEQALVQCARSRRAIPSRPGTRGVRTHPREIQVQSKFWKGDASTHLACSAETRS